MVPRGKVLLLGGIAEEDQWNTKENLITYQPYRDMLHRCQKFMPFLKSATVIEEEVRIYISTIYVLGDIHVSSTHHMDIIYALYTHLIHITSYTHLTHITSYTNIVYTCHKHIIWTLYMHYTHI